MYKTLLYDLTVHVGPVSPLYFKNVDDITTFKSFALRTIFITSYIINLLIQRFRSVRWLFLRIPIKLATYDFNIFK